MVVVFPFFNLTFREVGYMLISLGMMCPFLFVLLVTFSPSDEYLTILPSEGIILSTSIIGVITGLAVIGIDNLMNKKVKRR